MLHASGEKTSEVEVSEELRTKLGMSFRMNRMVIGLWNRTDKDYDKG